MPNGYLERDIEETPAYLDEVMGMLEPPAEDLNASGAPLPPPQIRQGFREQGYGVLEKFNPETGQRETFTAVNPPGTRLPQFPIPRPQRDPMEEMRKTINAIQFQKANDAYKAALSFQAARAYRQDLDAGKSQGEALARWGHMLPGGLAGAARMTEASRPAFTPEPLLGNTNLYRVGPRGERLFQYRPPRPPVGTGPVTEIPVLNQDGTPNPDYFAVPSATGNGFVLHPKRGKEPTLTPQGQLKYYDNRIKALQTERANLGVDAAAEQRRTQLNTELNDLQKQQQELFEKHSKKGGKTEAVSPEAPKGGNEVTRVTKDGRKAIFDATTKKFIRYAD